MIDWSLKKKKRTKNKNIFSDSFIENTRQSGRIIWL